MPVGTTKYCRDPGASVYPIRPGVIFKLKTPKVIQNPRLDHLRMAHDTFIWVQLVGPVLRGLPPKCRKCTIVSINVPQHKDMKAKYVGPWTRRVRFKYLTELLCKGYVIQGKSEWNYTKNSWTKFYTAIGLM